MHMNAIVKLARSLLKEHGYGDIPVQRSRAKTILGQAMFERDRFGDWRPKMLKLSDRVLPLLEEHEVRDTILHEIAHFKAGFKAAHGASWKSACRSLGARPERLARLEAGLAQRIRESLSKYRLTCGNPNCDTVYHRNRLPKGRRSFKGYSCGRCGHALKQEVLR